MPTPGGPVRYTPVKPVSSVCFTQSSLELTIPEEDSSLKEKTLQENLERIQREFNEKKNMYKFNCPLDMSSSPRTL